MIRLTHQELLLLQATVLGAQCVPLEATLCGLLAILGGRRAIVLVLSNRSSAMGT